ncbi:hypothetical protein FD12_GL002588 [Lentilactobacillus rapi DSM 19907 = JCM 15042]|uniref:Uncharacterized protein n=1 Tax=Lentilactobacillus rapi DSM 19907 = JCM 15042 TaxID=1423795 RepID=A0ABR5PDE1_9LACO|nr:hypothetical protein FD12_GL002588 [Lentilactobacillus rapi DSM 19907 = JCM 15042]
MKADIVARISLGTRSDKVAITGAIIIFKPNIQIQYIIPIAQALLKTPIKNNESPPTKPPPTTQGVRRPNTERVRSERFPNSRLEINEAIAVAALSTPKIAVEALGPTKSFKCCGSKTAETIASPPIHRRANTKKLSENLIRFPLLILLISGSLLIDSTDAFTCFFIVIFLFFRIKNLQ